ncbi:MAG: hypothetical protein L3J67_10005 [Hyphomicrobiaceae bacterium]|nr:hypothetical protein [Hyphomicrobiaceae bacterium]
MREDYERQYKVYALGVPSDKPQPWERPVWQQIENELAFLKDVCRGPIALRGSYLDLQPNGFYKNRGYGRLSWQSKSSDKWTYEDPEDEGRRLSKRFADVEAWGPHWKKCFSGQGAPDFYMRLTNTFPAPDYEDHAWRGELLLALSLDLPLAAQELFVASVHYIAGLLSCSHIGVRQAPWGVAYFLDIEGAFTSAINDSSPYDVRDNGNFHRPAHEALTDEWQLVRIMV